jgi:hypothetical protein
MQILSFVKMAGAYSKPFNISLFWYYIKQITNVFIRAMVRIFSFGERWNVPIQLGCRLVEWNILSFTS